MIKMIKNGRTRINPDNKKVELLVLTEDFDELQMDDFADEAEVDLFMSARILHAAGGVGRNIDLRFRFLAGDKSFHVQHFEKFRQDIIVAGKALKLKYSFKKYAKADLEKLDADRIRLFAETLGLKSLSKDTKSGLITKILKEQTRINKK